MSALPAPDSTVTAGVRLSADSTALILGGTTVPTPDDYYIETVKNHYITPTHPNQDFDYVPVSTPEQFWPLTGIFRLLASVTGSPEIWGSGGAGWPDQPWWSLSGLFDRTFDQSVQAGVADLETAMAQHGNDHLVIYGYSQGAMIAIREKRSLAEQYPDGPTAPDIAFVLSGDINLPNGGLASRFPGVHIPVLDVSFNGPEPTDTPFHTDVITRQYDGLADFPLYPLNVIADLNAILGAFYVHLNDLDVSLPADPTTSKYLVGTHGLTDTDYYFFPTADLPLFAPLRSLGVPESLIDVVEPITRWVVELGYDRTIAPWEPTPARFTPRPDSGTDGADLATAIGESITNAAALFGVASPPEKPVTAKTSDSQPATASPEVADPATPAEDAVTSADDPVSKTSPDADETPATPCSSTRDQPEAEPESVSSSSSPSTTDVEPPAAQPAAADDVAATTDNKPPATADKPSTDNAPAGSGDASDGDADGS